jgi:hypothetical protein
MEVVNGAATAVARGFRATRRNPRDAIAMAMPRAAHGKDA